MTADASDEEPFGGPSPDPELKRLEPLLGKWRSEDRTLDSVLGRGVPVTSTEEFYWLDGGYFLVSSYETVFGDEPAQSGVNYWGYDSEAKRFRIVFFSNNGPYTEDGNRYEGKVAQGKLTFDGPARFQYDLDDDGRIRLNPRRDTLGGVVAARRGRCVAAVDEQHIQTDRPAAMTSATAGRREWAGLAAIALPCVVYAMDLTVMNLAIPALSEDLQPSSSELLWIVDIYGFMVAGLLITMGTLGDRIGRRRLLLIGAAAFGLASLFAAASTSTEMLIAARALLGVAGATLAPSTLSLIRNMFEDPQQRTFAIGVWITSFSVGAAIGPLIGGLLLERFWWGSVFLPALPVMGLLLIVGPRLLPEYRDPNAGKPDLISVVLSLIAVLAAIYGLKRIAQDGLGTLPVLSIGAGLGLGAAFVRRQQRLADPLIDLRLFELPAFNGALAANTLGFFINFGIAVFIAQYLQLVVGLSPFEAGLWTLPYACSFLVGALLTPLLVRHIQPAFAMAAGLAVTALGFGLLTQVDGDSSLGTLVSGSVVFAIGLAPLYTLAADLMVGAAPPERAGAAAGISETSSEFGGALGIATLGAVGTAVYRGQIEDALPAGAPPEAAEAAQDTLGAAVDAGDELAGEIASRLVDAAQEAFTQALQVAAALSAAVAIAAAILAVTFVRRVRTSTGLEQERALEPVAVSGRPC